MKGDHLPPTPPADRLRILIIAPSWVGDAVMAQALFKRLKIRHSNAFIEVFAPAWVAPILRRMPEVNEVSINPFAHGELKLRVRWQLGRAIASMGFDQAIVLPNSLKSALVPFFAGIKKRTGYVGEMRYGLLSDIRRLEATAYPLMVERFALLAEDAGQPLHRPVPQPQLQVNPEQQAAVLLKLGLDSHQPAIALCPGAEFGPAKRWPTTHFAELATLLTTRGYQVWLVGSKKDQSIGEEITQGSAGRARNLCGQTTLDEAVDVLAASAAVVCNDSGLMHVTAALDKPLVALYGSSSPSFTPPLSDKATILNLNLSCSPCFQRTCPLGHLDCLNKMSPNQVLQALTTIC